MDNSCLNVVASLDSFTESGKEGAIDAIVEQIDQYEKTIANGTWNSRNTRLFRGADIVITNHEQEESYYDTTYVVSEHARKLSAVAFEMRELLHDVLDHMSRYVFYGKMAEAMNKAIESRSDFAEIALA